MQVEKPAENAKIISKPFIFGYWNCFILTFLLGLLFGELLDKASVPYSAAVIN